MGPHFLLNTKVSFQGVSSKARRQSRGHTKRIFRKNGGVMPSRGEGALGGNLDLLL